KLKLDRHTKGIGIEVEMQPCLVCAARNTCSGDSFAVQISLGGWGRHGRRQLDFKRALIESPNRVSAPRTLGAVLIYLHQDRSRINDCRWEYCIGPCRQVEKQRGSEICSSGH